MLSIEIDICFRQSSKLNIEQNNAQLRCATYLVDETIDVAHSIDHVISLWEWSHDMGKWQNDVPTFLNNKEGVI